MMMNARALMWRATSLLVVVGGVMMSMLRA